MHEIAKNISKASLQQLYANADKLNADALKSFQLTAPKNTHHIFFSWVLDKYPTSLQNKSQIFEY